MIETTICKLCGTTVMKSFLHEHMIHVHGAKSSPLEKFLRNNVGISQKPQLEKKSFNPQGILLWNCPICKENLLFSERSAHLNSTHANENTKLQKLSVVTAKKMPLPIFVRGGSPGLKKRK